MSIQIKLVEDQEIILRCVGYPPEDKPGNVVREFHVYMKKCHLFIVDNRWLKLGTKNYSYKVGRNDLEKVQTAALTSKQIERDGICINLNSFKNAFRKKKEVKK